MPHVRIEPGTPNITGQFLGHGTRLVVDGKPMRDVKDITLHFPCDGVVECHVNQIVTGPFDFEGDIDLHLHVHLPEGCKLVEMDDTKGHRVIRVVPPDNTDPKPDVGADVPGGGANP